MNHMIEIRGLTKAFGSRTALAGIDLDIAAGERVLLVGPNGAGKTTLLRILASLARPTRGTVRIAGQASATPAARRMIGYLSHASMLYDDLTARQNLRFYARMYGIPDAASQVEALLVAVGLARRANDLVRTYSRGMQQRLAVARAVLHHPRLLLLDEPYTGLDTASTEALTAYLQTLLQGGRTLIVATHHPAEEGRLAERVVVLRAGRVAADEALGDPDGFSARYRAALAPQAEG